MEYPYKLSLKSEQFNKDFVVAVEKSRAILGNTVNCDARFSREILDFDIEIDFVRSKSGWVIGVNEGLYIGKIYNSITGIAKSSNVKTRNFDGECGDVFTVYSDNKDELLFEVTLAIDFEATLPKINNYILLSGYKNITISSDEGADLVITSPYGAGNEVSIANNGTDYVLSFRKAPFGVFVNKSEVNENVRLKEYDYITFADVALFFRDGRLFFDKTKIKSDVCEIKTVQNEGIFEYPGFIRNTRIKKKINEENIKILDPSNKPEEPESNIFTRLLPAIVMLVLCILFRAVLNPSKSTFVMFSICSMGMGVITSIVGIVKTKKRYQNSVKKRRENYIRYVEEKRSSIADMRQKELDALRNRYFSNKENLEHILSFDTCLFDRDKSDEDFLDVYLGTGSRKAIRLIDYKEKEQLTEGDELTKLPMQVSETFEYIDEAPIILDVREAGAIGITGPKEALYDVFKNTITDICARQYYSDVKIVCLVDEEHYKSGRADFLKYLPHIQFDNSGDNTQRFIVVDEESKTSIFDFLYKVLSSREGEKEASPHYVIFALDNYGMRMHPLMKYVESASQISATFIFFEDKVQKLPQYCKYVIELDENRKGLMYDSEDSVEKIGFEYETITDEQMMEMAIELAPVYAEEISLSGSLRKSISLFELYGIYEINDLNLGRRWANSKVYDSMAVPLGINAKEQIVSLDLHEKYHGPHGLVAGTTGSGKSEILQSYILGAAMSFPPDEVGFLIIDFKGGGMANQFADLPHLLGAITNLEGKEVERSLKSIKAELLRRQNCFSEAGVYQIDKYIELYKAGKVKEMLPHLIIVVDEFAELKAEQPDFMKELISTARIGRSLGVHLILATQKPAGQVNDQIWSNSKFKLCLKVQTQADSNEVLKSPLAAEIREPGRAYLQVGNNEIFELFQSGYSGAPEKNVETDKKAYKLYEVDFKGNKSLIFEQKKKKQNEERSQLEAVVQYVKNYCVDNKVRIPKPICMPALPEKIEYSKTDSKEITVGIFDNPDNQYQGPLGISLDENTLVLGASGMGKTNLLMVMIRQICEKYTADEVNLYLLDFSSMMLKIFKRLNHVGGVVCSSDDEKMKNLVRMLYEILAERRNKMSLAGAVSFKSYCEAGNRDLPRIIVMIENFSAMKELFNEETEQLLGLLRDGLSVGMSFIITNNQLNGISYKYLAQISGRLAFFLNDSSSYSGFIGGRGLTPNETIGRCILNISKMIKECQIYQAFDGDSEEDKNESLQKWLAEMNENSEKVFVRGIPEIPNILMRSDLERKDDYIRLGLTYGDIQLVSFNHNVKNLLAITGREHFGIKNYINHIIKDFVDSHPNGEVIIFDNFKKILEQYKDISKYVIGTDELADIINDFGQRCEEEYQEMVKASDYLKKEKLIVINDYDVIESWCKDKALVQIYKNMISKYKALGVYIVLCDLPNVSIGVMTNDILKSVKESRQLVYFDDINNIKILDVPALTGRNFKKKLEIGDAYYINGTEIFKLKTPLIDKGQ